MSSDSYDKKIEVYMCSAKIEPFVKGGNVLLRAGVKIGDPCTFHTSTMEEMLEHLVQMHPSALLEKFANKRTVDLDKILE